MNAVAKHSGKMVCGALLAAVCTVAAPQEAAADPGVISLTAGVGPTGTGSPMSGNHVFGGPSTNHASPFGGGIYFITVSSGPSTRPGWDYEVTVNWNPFGPSSFTNSTLFHFNMVIKPENTPSPITAVSVKGANGQAMAGNLTWTNGSIHFDTLKPNLTLGGNVMIIQWNQGEIPAPGALALMGLAGLAGTRRRRA